MSVSPGEAFCGENAISSRVRPPARPVHGSPWQLESSAAGETAVMDESNSASLVLVVAALWPSVRPGWGAAAVPGLACKNRTTLRIGVDLVAYRGNCSPMYDQVELYCSCSPRRVVSCAYLVLQHFVCVGKDFVGGRGRWSTEILKVARAQGMPAAELAGNAHRVVV